jgi:hypothetical protein
MMVPLARSGTQDLDQLLVVRYREHLDFHEVRPSIRPDRERDGIVGFADRVTPQPADVVSPRHHILTPAGGAPPVSLKRATTAFLFSGVKL